MDGPYAFAAQFNLCGNLFNFPVIYFRSRRAYYIDRQFMNG